MSHGSKRGFSPLLEIFESAARMIGKWKVPITLSSAQPPLQGKSLSLLRYPLHPPPPSLQPIAMATTPLNSTTVIVDDTDPALVYSGAWTRFVKNSVLPRISIATHIFTVDTPDREPKMSSIARLMAVERAVLLYGLNFVVCCQCCPPSLC